MKNNKPESGAAAKPAESTARPAVAAAAAPAKEKITLTSDGIASLLKSEFAATDKAQPAQGEEVQPAGTAATLQTEGQEQEQPAEEQPAGQEQETQDENPETEEQNQEPAEEPAQEQEEGAVEGAELPEALREALEQYQGGELPPVLQAMVNKRIGKLTSQRETEKARADAAEARAQQLEVDLAAERQNGGKPRPEIEAGVDEKSLSARERDFGQFVSDAESFLDETATPEERERVERYMQSQGLDNKGLARHVREANKLLQQIPQQRQQLAEFRKQEQASEPVVKKHFPWLDNKASPEYQEAQTVLSQFPELKQRTPFHRTVLGVYVLGLQQFKKLLAADTQTAKPAATAPAKPKVTVKAPPKPPTAGAAAPAAARTNGNAAAESAAREKFQKAPTRENVANLIKIGLRS